jgi:hypothetical protein
MVDVPFPLLTAPGRVPQAAGGRLINCYPETLPKTAGKPYGYWRTPGLKPWATTSGVNFRGALLVNNLIYAVIDNSVWTFPAAGGAGTQLTGTVLGNGPVTMARNNALGPDIAIVAPGNGAYRINPQPLGATPPGTNNAVVSYPNGSGGFIVGSPNAVTYLLGFFFFTYPNAQVFSSDPDTSANPTNINALNFATAQSKPDTLYRPIPYNGQLLLCGANSLEVWGAPINLTGFPLSYVSTISRGVVGINAIAGHDDGFGKGIFFVGDDAKVSTLSGYTPTPVSVPDLDLKIEGEPDKTVITTAVYVSQGHGVVVIQGPNWCWEYDTTLQTWHERKSHLVEYWRGLFPLLAFGNTWVCGDRKSGNLAVIDGKTATEFGDPLRMRIETGPLGAFPNKIRINAIELYLTKGVGMATGIDPLQTDPDVSISISRDGGQTWSNPRVVKIGRQSLTDGRVRSAIWGQAQNQGVRWRLQESAPLSFGFMGADMLVEQLK